MNVYFLLFSVGNKCKVLSGRMQYYCFWWWWRLNCVYQRLSNFQNNQGINNHHLQSLALCF